MRLFKDKKEKWSNILYNNIGIIFPLRYSTVDKLYSSFRINCPLEWNKMRKVVEIWLCYI